MIKKFLKGSFIAITISALVLTNQSSSVKADEKSAPVFDANQAVNHISYLSETIGVRVGGTEEERQASEYVKAEFDKLGYNTEIQEFGFDVRREEQFIINGETEIPLRASKMTALTGEEEIETEIVDLEFGDQEEYPEEVEGKIVFIQRGNTSFRTAAKKASDAGAVAVIVSDDTEEYRAFRPGTSNEQVDIPLAGITMKDGEELKKVLEENEETTASLLVNEHENQTSQNVIAVKEAVGVENPDIVYVTSHIDSVPFAPGANDNASGTGLIIELAKGVSQYDTNTEIRFIAFGHEETGAVPSKQGSKYYVDNLSEDEKNRSIANFNFDMVATSWEPATSLNLNIVDGQANILKEYADEAADELGMDKSIINVFKKGSSDHETFFDAGIDSANFSWRVPGTADLEPYYHSPADTMEHISTERMDTIGTLISTVLFQQFHSETPEVDNGDLNDLVTEIDNDKLIESDYTADSWNFFQSVLDDAQALLTSEDATQEEIDEIFNLLTEAYEGLEEVTEEVDNGDLNDLVTEIDNDKLIESDYTADSWNFFQSVLDDAQALLTSEDATQEEIDEMFNLLTEAYEGLEEVTDEVNKDDLESLVEVIMKENFKESAYTPESWNVFKDDLETAVLTLENADATEDEVKEALVNLQKALDGLVKIQEKEKTKEDNQEEEEGDENKTTGPEQHDGDTGSELPSTATSIYNLILIGSIIVIVGALLLYIRHRRIQEQQ